MSAHDAAEMIRKTTAEGFPAVQRRYGYAYANGWRTGRLRAADALETIR